MAFKFCFHWKIKEITAVLINCVYFCLRSLLKDICVFNSIHLLGEIRKGKRAGMWGLQEELSAGLTKASRSWSSVYVFSGRLFCHINSDNPDVSFPNGPDSSWITQCPCLLYLMPTWSFFVSYKNHKYAVGNVGGTWRGSTLFSFWWCYSVRGLPLCNRTLEERQCPVCAVTSLRSCGRGRPAIPPTCSSLLNRNWVQGNYSRHPGLI